MKRITYLSIIITALVSSGCSNLLDLEPKDKIQGDAMFSDPAGVKLYMANLYYQLPIEDFSYAPNRGFNFNTGDPNNAGLTAAHYTDEATHTEYGDFTSNNLFEWWTPAYKLNRDVNILIDEIPELDILESERKKLIGESSFIRAYLYFALAKRYGGVPLITNIQEYTGNIDALKVPRNTEKETWDLVLKECNKAIENLPESWGGERRATKWVALALKSRAMLHAASVAKYWNEAPLSGDAVNLKLIGGLTNIDSNKYYEECIKASESLIESGVYSLYMPTPETPQEAAVNIKTMFENPNKALNEAIFIKGFAQPGADKGHNYDIWYNPNQTAFGWPHPGRMNPTLDIADIYECYDNPGKITPIVTTKNGIVDNYEGFNPNEEYLRFDSPSELFANRDARMHATLVIPSSTWKGKKIIIQGGIVKSDGSTLIETKGSVDYNGTTYYTYGAESVSEYSGFDTYGGNMTKTGFGFKKFLQEEKNVIPGWNQSTTDFADMRYAEVLLNYAEAVVESNYNTNNSQEKAAKAINDIRRRAGHMQAIPLTLENVLRERQVELAFENKRYWDLIRRREYHTAFNNHQRKALLPLLDLRSSSSPQYIFVRKRISKETNKTFEVKFYYKSIPGIETTGIIQNPQY